MNTFITVFRSILDSKQFQNETCFKVWMWCLLKKADRPYTQIVGRQQISLKSGQFIFGRKAASEQLNMPQSTVWFWMLALRADNSLDIKSNNKFSVISIVNHGKYRDILDSLLDNRRTTKEHKQVNRVNKMQSNNTLKNETKKDFSKNTILICEDLSINPTSSLDRFLKDNGRFAFRESAMLFVADCEDKGVSTTASGFMRWAQAGIKKGMVKQKEILR